MPDSGDSRFVLVFTIPKKMTCNMESFGTVPGNFLKTWNGGMNCESSPGADSPFQEITIP
jgi:hypothetical protein